MTRAMALPLLLLSLSLGCAATGPRGSTGPRISDVAREGDPARRASLRLVDQGLATESGGAGGQAVAQYERALAIDPTNPYAYMALARHFVEVRDYERSLEYVAQAEVLLGSGDADSPRAEAHIAGLRGWALHGMGRDRQAAPLLEEARDLDPAVWSDGRLSADELR